MKEITVRDICGDYAVDVKLCDNSVFTLYFNSRQNALNVKRIMEVDGIVPNVATVCDMVEVVRCKDCEYYEIHKPRVFRNCERNNRLMPMTPNDFCSCGKRKDGAEE